MQYPIIYKITTTTSAALWTFNCTSSSQQYALLYPILEWCVPCRQEWSVDRSQAKERGRSIPWLRSDTLISNISLLLHHHPEHSMLYNSLYTAHSFKKCCNELCKTCRSCQQCCLIIPSPLWYLSCSLQQLKDVIFCRPLLLHLVLCCKRFLNFNAQFLTRVHQLWQC